MSISLTRDELKALEQMLEYAAGEHGKSQKGYFSPAGWCGHTLAMLLERAKADGYPSPGAFL